MQPLVTGISRYMKKAALILLALTTIAAATTGPARAELTISPLRVIFEGRTRSAEVMLLNRSDRENTYRLEWRYNKMMENGSYEQIDSTLTPEFDIADHVIFSPRQVTLPPGGRQKIRLSLRRPPEMPEGEYRAHLAFRRLAKEEAPSAAPEKGINLSIQVNLGFSIPVIVRSGSYDTALEIGQPRFIPASEGKKGKPQLEMDIKRTGKHGAVGKVTVHWDGANTPDQQIGLLNNVSIFPEMDHRTIQVDVQTPSIPSGNITIKYHGEGPQKGQILAEKTFPVGG